MIREIEKPVARISRAGHPISSIQEGVVARLGCRWVSTLAKFNRIFKACSRGENRGRQVQGAKEEAHPTEDFSANASPLQLPV